MATKTVVCPVCGLPAGPGRYACAECGALLAAVGAAPRGRRSAARSAKDADLAPGGEPEAVTEAAEAAEADEPARSTVAGAASVAAEAAPDVAALALTAELSAEPAAVDPVEPTDEPDDPFAAAAVAFDDDAPLAAASRSIRQPDVLHDLPDPEPIEATPIAGTATIPDDAPSADAAMNLAAPSWPPPGDLGPVAAPEPRTPAGAYLPPSAVLPPLDGAIGAGGPVAGAMALPAGSASPRAAWADRGSAALTDALGSIRVAADAPRRAVAVGAGLAALGILLPWVNSLPGASPLANYLDRWGLAGPGLWLVLVGLVALAAVAASSGRAASWPVGLPAIVTAAFLAGLVWPYAFGGFGRSIGTWVVVVGAVVLLVGGLFDRRGRHDRGDAIV